MGHMAICPISSCRRSRIGETDAYGGDFAGRSRFMIELVTAMREAWPCITCRSAIRLSALDDLPEGWTLDDTLRLIPLLRAAGADLFDISIGGIRSSHRYPSDAGALALLAAEIRAKTAVPVGVSWGIATPQLANDIIAREQADLVILGRAMLRDPY